MQLTGPNSILFMSQFGKIEEENIGNKFKSESKIVVPNWDNRLKVGGN